MANIDALRMSRTVQLTIVSSLAFVGGATAGYMVASNRLREKYEEISRQERAAQKDYYEKLYSKKVDVEKPRLEDLVAKYDEDDIVTDEEREFYQKKLNEYGGSFDTAEPQTVEEKAEVQESLSKNIFTDHAYNDENFNYEEELERRDKMIPYIIAHDEFMENEPDYNQISLTYFEGDDVLADDKDQPVEDKENTVGEDNLERFGHGSKDNNMVYVRNERLGVDFEIVRSNGKYVEEVLGFIEHSDKPGVRKFRDYD